MKKNILFALFLLLVSFVLIEVACRAYLFYRDRQLSAKNLPNPATMFSNYYQEDAYLGWKNRPNISERYTVGTCTGLIEFDSAGFRVGTNADDASSKDLPVVLIMGDSMVGGFEVNGNQTMAAVVSREFARRGTPVKVINGGVRGYNVLQMNRAIEGYLKTNAIRHIVLLTSGNDIWENLWPQSLYRKEDGNYVSGPYYTRDAAGALSVKNAPSNEELIAFCGLGTHPALVRLGFSLIRYQNSIASLRAFPGMLLNVYRESFLLRLITSVNNYVLYQPYGFAGTEGMFEVWDYSVRDLIRNVNTLSPETKMTVLTSLVVQDKKRGSIPKNRYDDTLSAISRETGVGYLNLTEKMAALYDERKKECVSDGHYVPYEHELIGKIVADAIYETVAAPVPGR